MKILKYIKIAILYSSIFKTRTIKPRCTYCNSNKTTSLLNYKSKTGYKPKLAKCNNCYSVFYIKGN